MITQVFDRHRLLYSNLVLIAAMVVVSFAAVATLGTQCAQAATGSCAVGNSETFSSNIIVNDDGDDADTRFEGDTNANLLYLDAGNDAVLLNASAPIGSELLYVNGAANITGGGTLTGTWSDLGTVSTIDINGGTIDGITDLKVVDGGTGLGTFTDAGVLIGNGTGNIQVTTAGTSGQVLTSNGAGVDPTFQSLSSTHIATGEYTGDGTTSYTPSNACGFAAKEILITTKQTAASVNPFTWYTTDIMVDNNVSGLSVQVSDVGNRLTEVNAIIAITATSFTVDDAGANADPNVSGTVYEYVCRG